MKDVSIIIPAYNAENTLAECLQSVTALDWECQVELILIDDGSTDRTGEIAASFPRVKIIVAPHQGAAHATNLGIKTASHELIVLVDADAALEKDWLKKVAPAFNDPSVAAAGGCVVTANRSAIGRIAGYDVELRLANAPEKIDHLSTANTAYRRQVLLDIGLLTEELKADYDVDLSRRLKAAGYRLTLVKNARCRHYWKDTLASYLWQQYNYAYYRMTLARKFGKAHDRVTGPLMILQVPFTLLVLLAAILGSLATPWALLALLLIPTVHLPETLLLLFKRRDAAVLLMPSLFTARSLTWLWAAIIWSIRQITRSGSETVAEPPPRPSH